MSELAVDDFEGFFRELWGKDPFPWQSRLARLVHRGGVFPAALDLPTGTGKTATIDIAVFAMALEARLSPNERRIPRRLALVVDRRTVVDQAYTRALEIRKKLRLAKMGVLALVADHLRALSGDSDEGAEPLEVALMRGALPRDDSWARSPVQPTVVLSTVDQVGSRLFFRGYGVSPTMRSLHAGLLGNDLLLLLDEVHLSRPFADTLDLLERHYRDRVSDALPRRFQVVRLSATHRVKEGASEPFRLESEDLEHPVLNRRVHAGKPAALEELKVSGEEAAKLEQIASALAKRSMTAAEVQGATIGVVVNRVATARHLFQNLLQAKAGGKLKARLALVTGRMRPLDRQKLEDWLRPFVVAGRERQREQPSFILVATQCIEAGADFDFDVLLTECASLDALRQRFGRLNRLGDIDDARAIVFARSDIGKDEDPVYGAALAATWQFLKANQQDGKIDFGIDSFKPPEGEALAGLLSPVSLAPLLLPAHLEAWSQTAPAPEPDPDVSLWLHGLGSKSDEVQVVWRGDLDQNLLENLEGHEPLAERLSGCPPLSSEALSLPLFSVKQWLRSSVVNVNLADVEKGLSDEDDRIDDSGRSVLVYRDESWDVVPPTEIRPGDTVVVPSAYGGLFTVDESEARGATWDPQSTTPVRDLGELAHLRQRRRALLRLNALTLMQNFGALGALPVPTPNDEEDSRTVAVNLREFLGNLEKRVAPSNELFATITQLVIEMSRRPGLKPIQVGSGDAAYWLLVGRGRAKADRDLGDDDETTTEDDGSSHLGVAVALSEHLLGVGAFAERFARHAGLSEALVSDLRLAGELHDVGKADPRFQRMLHGGDEFRALTAPSLLAKSAVPALDRKARQSARLGAGYPSGTRHELVSLALLEQALDVRRKAGDWDLVQHLVASHHGYCRPFAPVEQRADEIQVAYAIGSERLSASTQHKLARLDSGVSDRFFELSERYGIYGLAWLETILRLADHRRSEWEQARNLMDGGAGAGN